MFVRSLQVVLASFAFLGVQCLATTVHAADYGPCGNFDFTGDVASATASGSAGCGPDGCGADGKASLKAGGCATAPGTNDGVAAFGALAVLGLAAAIRARRPRARAR